MKTDVKIDVENDVLLRLHYPVVSYEYCLFLRLDGLLYFSSLMQVTQGYID